MRQELPAHRLALLVLLAASARTGAQVTDELIYADAKINPEFSVDYRHLAWTKRTPMGGGGTRSVVWYDRMNRANGLPATKGAFGTRVGPSSDVGLPQWGQAAPPAQGCANWDGNYAVYLTADYYFGKIYGTAQDEPCIEVLGADRDPAPLEQRRLRVHPFPMKNRNVANQWVSYQVNADGMLRVFLVDLRSATLHPVLVHEEPRRTSWGSAAGTFYSRPWWAVGGTRLYFGAYDPRCHDACPVQIAYVDTAQLNVPEALVTFDDLSKVSMYPYLLGDVARFIAGNDFEATATVYRQANNRSFVIDGIVPFEYWQSGLVASDGTLDPFLSQSFEVYDWDGDSYASYTVSEENADGNSSGVTDQTEVWVLRLTAAKIMPCRVSAPDASGLPLSRTEPEPVVLNSHAYLYYSAGPIATSEADYAYQVRRIDLGAKAVFDLQCAAGTVTTQ